MDALWLNDLLIREYQAFCRLLVQIGSKEIRSKVNAGYAERRFWSGPLPQIEPHYRDGGSLKMRVGEPESFRL